MPSGCHRTQEGGHRTDQTHDKQAAGYALAEQRAVTARIAALRDGYYSTELS